MFRRIAAPSANELEALVGWIAGRLCRYMSRPAVAEERLALTARGDVHLQLKTPYRDGTTHIVLDPLDFLARLAVLVPPPRSALQKAS